MMKKLLPILTAIFLAFGSNGQAPSPYPILVDSQRDTVAGLQVFQANQITFRASYRSGNATNNLVAVTPFMYWQPYGPTNATVVTGRWTIVSASSGTVDFAFTPADLNFATGTYTYQIGLNVSGGPNVIKQGSFIIKASQASIGASPIAFATTNINWGSINWTGLPAYEYQTNTIAISNALNSQIASVSNALNTALVNASNALNTRITANETGKVAKAGDTMTGNLGFTNSGLTSLDVVDWDLAPTSTIQQGRLQWEASRDTLKLGLDANVNLDVGQQLMLYAKSIETNTINKGEVVFVAGAAGDNPTVKRASHSSEALSSRTIGIAAENIASNNNGFIVTRGTIYNLNTTNFAQGAMLYLGPNGTMQTNLPDAPLHGVFMGVVERVGANNGQIYVAVQNYQELEELSDVKITGVANNDLIVWNSASNRWQNATLASLNISTGGGITVESDPIFVAASNSFYPRSNPSNFITTAALSGYATGTPLYVEADPTAVTNVTASGRITATPSGKQVALTFDASGLATGTPIYSVAGLATGTPLYTFTETDTIATNRLTNYYTITAADAKFATGTPLYVEAAFNANSNRITALEGYTNMAASALASSVWASADSTTNYALRTTFNSSTNFLNNKFTNYLPLAGGALDGNLDLNGSDIDGLNAISFGSGRYIDSAGTMAGGDFTFSSVPVIPGYLTTSTWATADSTTNYASRITFNSTSNGFNTRITTVEGYTNRAASALASSVWASADSTTNYASRVTFGSFTSAYATADATTNYASRITFNATSNSLNSRILNVATGAVYVTNLSSIAGSGLNVVSNQLRVTNIVTASDVNAHTTTNFVWASQPATQIVNANSNIIYNAQRYGFITNQQATSEFPNIFVANLAGIGGYTNALLYSKGPGNASRLWTESEFSPSTYVTISAGNTNYWRITTAPTNATESGQRGQIAVASSNVFIYSPDALGTGTGRWIRIQGSISWP